jgi:hypothetical protein
MIALWMLALSSAAWTGLLTVAPLVLVAGLGAWLYRERGVRR